MPGAGKRLVRVAEDRRQDEEAASLPTSGKALRVRWRVGCLERWRPAAQISRMTGANARARKLAATIWDRAPGARPRPLNASLTSTGLLWQNNFAFQSPTITSTWFQI